MSHTSESEGFRAYFRHLDGYEYSVLFKGHSLASVAKACMRESQIHNVILVRLEPRRREVMLNLERIVLPDDDFDRLVQKLEEPPKPSPALRELANRYGRDG